MILKWQGTNELQSRIYICGHCGEKISSNEGYYAIYNDPRIKKGFIYICHTCGRPTYFDLLNTQIPGQIYGIDVKNITSKEVEELYKEARRCMSINAYTSAVICCRKLLMNIAVSLGAEEGRKFAFYVEYLNEKGYIPPNGKQWVDTIRKKGNEANHEIKIMYKEDAELLLDFVGMLMKFIYEFPAMIRENND